MSNAVVHAENSVKRWGGDVSHYLLIHKWLDQCKSQVGDNRHRAILHNAWGIQLATERFGDYIEVPETPGPSRMKRVFVKDIAEQHVLEDLGFIPSLAECLADLPCKPWLAGMKLPHRGRGFDINPVVEELRQTARSRLARKPAELEKELAAVDELHRELDNQLHQAKADEAALSHRS